jgi:hypothetical protein
MTVEASIVPDFASMGVTAREISNVPIGKGFRDASVGHEGNFSYVLKPRIDPGMWPNHNVLKKSVLAV